MTRSALPIGTSADQASIVGDGTSSDGVAIYLSGCAACAQAAASPPAPPYQFHECPASAATTVLVLMYSCARPLPQPQNPARYGNRLHGECDGIRPLLGCGGRKGP